jgi:ribosomal subunit interface protein
MSFENISFKITNTEIPETTKDLLTKKFTSLEKYIGNAPFSCRVEFEKVTHHNNGDVCRLETNLEVNGKFYRAETTTNTFEKAIDIVHEDLERELKHDHSKHNTLLKTGGRKLKEMLRFGN